MPVILIVDDSATDRKLAGRLLEKRSEWSLVYAENGVEGLQVVATRHPDLVITDLMMPRMNGLELVAAIKRDSPQTPVILMTSQGSEEIAVQALQVGAASYVPKRCLAQDLVETVGRVLSASQEERTQSRLIMERMVRHDAAFVLDNDLGLIPLLVRYLQQITRCMSLGDEMDRLRVSVALEEALVNAIYHGNLEVSSKLREVDHKSFYDLARQRRTLSPFRDRRVFVDVQFSQEGARYIVRDEGPGFDPQVLPNPTDPAYLDRPCGRGLLLMRTFMDEVTYNAAGNQVTLFKRRKAPPAPHV